MKFKALFTMIVAGCMTMAAQSQGYKDGVEYYKADQYENAKTILTNTLNQSTTDKAVANYYLGQSNLALGDKAAAKACFDAGVAANADCAYNYVGLGALELLGGNANAAADYFKKAQGLAKKDYEVLVAIARAYYNADPVKYSKELQKYLDKAHKDSKHTEPSIYILEGDMLYDNNDFGGAAGKYEMAISYDNANPEGYVKYAKSYFKVNPQFSISKLEEFLRISPNSALAQRELAEKLYEANYWNRAAEQYGRYIQNPNHFPEDKARYAVLLYYGEKYSESLKVANEVLAQQPTNFLMQRLKFLNEAKLGDNQAAVADGQAFFANNPNGYFTSNDYVTYADALSAIGEDAKAQEQYEIAAAKFPDNSAVLSNLSNIYTRNKDYVKAAETYELYIASLEKPEVNDYFTASARYLNVAATAGDDAQLRHNAAEKGLSYVDQAIAQAQPNPVLYQRKARLQIAANNNIPDAASIESYNDMIALLDQDPANADASNPSNDLSMYREAYMFMLKYYNEVQVDKDQSAKYSNLVKEVNEKLGL